MRGERGESVTTKISPKLKGSTTTRRIKTSSSPMRVFLGEEKETKMRVLCVWFSFESIRS